MLDYVCDELIAEIFERLPVKSLIRFRSLSKSWCSRIVSPDFIRKHTLRSAKNPQKVLIRHLRYLEIDDFEDLENDGMEDLYTLHSENRLPLNNRDTYNGITPVEFPVCHDFDIVGSCNGILCLFNHESNGITLWNPSIRPKLALPHHSSLRNSSEGGPRSVAVGFGFDPATNDYKIVRISFSPIGENAPELLVYTINKGGWRAITSLVPFSYHLTSIDKPFICACFVNGALHWVAKESYNIGHCCIMSFDVSTEVFSKIQLPEPEVVWFSRQLMILDGSLATISSDGVDSWIWVMKEYNNVASWSMVFKLERARCKGAIETVYFRTINGDLVFKAYSGGFKVYNPAARVQSSLVGFKAGSKIVDMETCVETLVLLNNGTPCKGKSA